MEERQLAMAFPVIGGGSVRILEMIATRAPDADGRDRPFRLMTRPNTQAMGIDILSASRFDEPRRRAEEAVYFKFGDSNFTGDSFGLSLAVADKLIRHRADIAGRYLIGTGSVIPNGRGALAEVSGFDDKMWHVLAEIETGALKDKIVVLFVVEENFRQAPADLRRALDDAEKAGRLRTITLTRTADIIPRWTQCFEVAEDTPRPTRMRRLAWAAAGLAGIGACAAALQFTPATPEHLCEAALDALAKTDDADTIRVALGTCSAARAAAMQPARIDFLLGQIHSINGSERLAERYWRAAAEGGDPDGMATMGRLLRTKPAGPEADIQAVAWLKAAIAAGRNAAKEDLGWMYHDGRGGLGQDPSQATSLWLAAGTRH